MEATSNTKQQMWFPEELWCKIKDYNTIPKKPEKPHPICHELNFIFKELAWNLLIYENLYDDNDTYDYRQFFLDNMSDIEVFKKITVEEIDK